MRLFVNNPMGHKQYLAENAPNRRALAEVIGSPIFTLFGNNYHVRDVCAEPAINTTASGSLIGGLIGSALEPGLGTLIGGLFGGLVGNRAYQDELKKVQYFNQSTFPV